MLSDAVYSTNCGRPHRQGIAGEPAHDRMQRIRRHERQQIDAARAAAPEDRWRHESSLGNASAEAVQHRRQRPRARQCRDQGDLDRRPLRATGQFEMRAPPNNQTHHHQRGEDQHRVIEAAHVHGDAQQRELTAAPEHQAGDQSSEADDQHVEQPDPRSWRGLCRAPHAKQRRAPDRSRRSSGSTRRSTRPRAPPRPCTGRPRPRLSPNVFPPH